MINKMVMTSYSKLIEEYEELKKILKSTEDDLKNLKVQNEKNEI